MSRRRRTAVQTVAVILCIACADDERGAVPAGPRSALSAPSLPAAVTLAGAGNVSICGATGATATAALLDSIPGTVFSLGDAAYPDGTAADYQSCYDPTWGRHKARTFPAPGNRDYDSSATADGYFGYFGVQAGDTDKGYYSYDLGAWHVIVLNSNYHRVSTAAGSPQEQWLKADLAAHPAQCTVAMWHHPRFYSTTSTAFYPGTASEPFWDDLFAAGADLVLNGHMRDYERFALQRPDGTPDSAGIREIIVGTGGSGLDEPNTLIIPNSEVQISGEYGVLRLTLSAGSYTWQFVPAAGATVTDSGTTACHHAGALPPPPPPPLPPPANVAPVAVPGGPYAGVDTVRFDGSRSFDPDSNLPLTFAWTFGDGASGTGATPLHLYGPAGTYTVALIVTDAKGAKSAVATTLATIQGRTLPAITTGSCLTQLGPTLTLSGVQRAEFLNQALAPNTKLDASGAQFQTGTLYPLRVSGTNLCVHGGQVLGAWEPATPWSFMFTTYGVLVDSGSNVTVENVWIYNYGNGVSFQQPAPNWTVRSSYFAYGRDGCVENDFQNSGTVDDVLMDCYDPFASSGGYAVDGTANLFTVKNSLIHAEPMDGVYSGPVPGTTGIFEWASSSPRIALYNNVFRADQNSNELYLAPPPGKLFDCSNNVMIWLGAGPFPEPLPATFNGKPCFTLMTGQAGVDYWNAAVARWKASHPTALPDIAPPVVSLFSPGVVGSTTLTGVVSLTATAGDDHGVAAVRFQLDGQPIGADVTVDSPPTKYTLSWDSRAAANGTHTLTATATDTSGNSTTSNGIAVTVSN
jgi:PKD repeat protein